MPRVGPGDDNVTGSEHYSMDLGLAPDLGNLLQNLQVANDYLDQAEQRFRTISDVVGSTTQKLAAATRQTQLLAAETQRLQNSYQAISNSSVGMSMGPMGGMPMGGMGLGYGYGGGYGPNQGAYPNMGAPGGTNIVQSMPTGVEDQNASYIPPQSTTGPDRMPGFTALRLEQSRELVKSARDWANKLPLPPWVSKIPGMGRPAGTLGGTLGKSAAAGGGAAPYPFRPDIAATAGGIGVEGVEGVEGALPAAPAAAGAAGAYTGIGSTLAALGPLAWIGAGAYGLKKGYSLWAGAQAESRRIAGLTGGEAGVAGMMGSGEVPGSLALSTRANFMGLVHPGVDYGEIQQRALGAGYVGGQYSQTRDYLFETYKRGLGTTIDQLDLYKEAVDKAGGSTGQLTNSMDRLRSVARNSNVSISVLMENMQQQVEQLTGIGVGGGAAIYQATAGATAFANAPMGSLNPNLRAPGGYSITNPFTQVQFAQQAGISVGQTAGYLYSHPEANVNVMGEKSAITTLTTYLGFKKGQTVDELNQYVESRGWAALNADGSTILGSILQQLGILPQNLDPAEYTTVLQWVWSTLNETPQQTQAAKDRAALKGGLISGTAGAAQRFGKAFAPEASKALAVNTQGGVMGAINMLTEGGLSMGMGLLGLGKGASSAMTGQVDTYVQDKLGLDLDSRTGQFLQKQFSQPGAKTSPALEKILSGDSGTGNTYVKTDDGRIIRMDDWIRTAPDWQGALASGRVTIAHADAGTQEAIAKTGTGTRGIEKTRVGQSDSLQFNTTQEEMNNTVDHTDFSKKGHGQFSLDNWTIHSLAEQIGTQVASHL